MGGRSSRYLALWLSATALAAGAGACGSDGDVADEELFGSTTEKRTSRSTLERVFDTGAHKLYMKCQGTGSPTVVYLHGSVQKRGEDGSATAGEIPALLDDHNRVCVYDRVNVGRSDAARGPLTGRDSAKDLHALLAAARIRRPYVLLGASLGGAIADIYAAAYPADVAGMVLLDSTLPAYLDMYKRHFPPGAGPQPGEWRDEAEKLDRLATFREAGRIQSRKLKMPVTYIGIESVLGPKITAVIRKAQRAFVDRFSPGRLIVLDVPHSMQSVIPERIAREVRAVIRAAKRR